VHLSVADFVQRLIQHIPPSGKRAIRYYGLYHANAQAKLVAARAARAMPPIGPAWEDDFGELA